MSDYRNGEPGQAPLNAEQRRGLAQICSQLEGMVSQAREQEFAMLEYLLRMAYLEAQLSLEEHFDSTDFEAYEDSLSRPEAE